MKKIEKAIIHCGRKGKLPGAQTRAVYHPAECVYVGPFNASMGKFMQKMAACRTIEQGPNTISCIV